MDESKHNRINREKWNRWSKTVDNDGSVYNYLRKAQDNLLSIIEFKEGVSMLDIGCGTGYALGQAALRIQGRGVFYGVDIAPGMIAKAKSNFADRSNFHFIEAGSDDIPLENGLFDIIICTNSFHHYLHPQQALMEMGRLLKKGGRVYILDPTADRFIIRIADKILKILEPAHVRIYSTNEYQSMMKTAGLEYTGNRSIHGSEKVHIGKQI
jgi:ubiquinone/menaquinone biosynthesis C-methylase UbiE